MVRTRVFEPGVSGRLPTLQTTAPPFRAHPAVADTKVTPPGRVSVTVTPVASRGPALVMMRV